ncbi:MAG: S8 family peptidase [Pseudomonadota bacterium]
MKLTLWQPGLIAAAAMALTACGGGGGGESISTADSASMSSALAAKRPTAGRIEPSDVAARATGTATFIVRMAEEPVTAYTGGVKGYGATKASAGRKIDPDAPAVASYKGYLASRHDAALAGVGGATKVYSYGYVFNGFAARMTEAQALKLAQTPGVLSVSRNEVRTKDTSSTPAFLGLSGPTGWWATKGTGENIVIGVIDTGIWPEHPSFSDRTGTNGSGTQDGKLSYQNITTWHGKCQNGDQFNHSHCNQKLIGARYYNAGLGGDAGVAATLPWEFNSPRDYDGHGTHTASTAAGNEGVQATGTTAALGKISGIAPRARISVYKALWSQSDGTGSGTTDDLLAAIDQAVADGVDVINYSVSGSRTNFRDAVEIAFLYAADAGIFVATSAGNNGPTISTVAHPSPWVTTVAAGTHNRSISGGSVTLGNGATYTGSGYLLTAGPAPLVDAGAVGLAGANAATLAQCYGTADGAARLDPAKVAGKIVLCHRGGNVLVNKAAAVKEAGGVGMVLVNVPGGNNTTPFVAYDIAAVHLTVDAYAPLKAYVATANPTATIGRADILTNVAAPYTADFSSRGPLLASGSLLKPDLIAPGQDILAGVAPPNNGGKLFDLYSGTSMSSPHVAGLAALMKQQHPTWSPMAIKSALMTTGTDVLDGANTDSVVIFRQGAGHVRPMNAADPGLVFDSGFADWLGFLCGTQLPVSFCTDAGVPVIEPSNFNGASIALGKLAGSQKITRTVTNVGNSDETYTFSVEGMTGITVALPAPLKVAKGKSATFELTFTSTPAAALNTYTGGQLTLTGDKGVHKVRLPMVVNPVALAAPAEVSGSYKVTFGYSGAFTATPRGLIAPMQTPGTVSDDPTDSSCSLTSPNAVKIPVTVAAGTTYARFSLFDADVNAGTDLDLCVYRGTTLVGASGSGTSAEEVNLVNPVAAVYTVVVQGWGVAGSSPFKLHSWLLGDTAAGNMTVSAPATATIAQSGDIGLTFSGLVAKTKYLGSVAYGGAAGMPNPTIVRVDTP